MLGGVGVGEARVPGGGRRGELVSPGITPGEDEGGAGKALELLMGLDLADGADPSKPGRVANVAVEAAEDRGAARGLGPVPCRGDDRRAVGVDSVGGETA